MTTTDHPHTPLIQAAELQALLQTLAPVVVLDASFDLADTSAGLAAFKAAHIPGAVYVHLDADLSGARTGRNGRHPLPERATFAATAGRLGITPATQVVVYDRHGAMYAARAWWMLRWLGHTAVAVLDGGLAAWQAAGLPVASGDAAPETQPPYPATEPCVATLDADELRARLGTLPLLDARAPERFRGDTEPLDTQAGHIPGARNRFFKDNLASDGRFKPADVLRTDFTALLGDRAGGSVVQQCGSGVTACHNVLAMDVAGLHGSVLYAGSWSEWSADPSRPVARS